MRRPNPRGLTGLVSRTKQRQTATEQGFRAPPTIVVSGGADPTAIHSGDSAGGDLDGTFPAPNVVSILGLWVVRGIVDTSGGGSVIAGIDLALTRNGVGDLSVDFDGWSFSDVPSVDLTAVAIAGERVSANLYSAASRTETGFRLVRFDAAGAAADGVVDFCVIGPA